jgi:hypothetical protein
MLDIVWFSSGKLNFKCSVSTACIINLPQMCCIRYPEAGEPFMVQIINVIKNWQHHPTGMSILQEEWLANDSIIHAQFIKVFQHLHQKSSCDASFGQSPIKQRMCFPWGGIGRPPAYDFFIALDVVTGNVNTCFPINWNVSNILIALKINLHITVLPFPDMNGRTM